MSREQAKARLRAAASGRCCLREPGSARKVLGAAFVAGFLMGVSPRIRRAAGSALGAIIQRLCR